MIYFILGVITAIFGIPVLQSLSELVCGKIEAMKILEKYCSELDKPNKSLSLTHNCFSDTETLETNYFRELLYNLEHSIHHQALIKVALYRLPHIKISDSFGIAPSTLEYRKQCAQ
jgi:hypothetical protein